MSASHIEFANAKLTRTLRVVGRRADGYHLIESEMVSLDLADVLEFDDGEALEIIDEVRLVGSRPRPDLISAIPWDETNLVIRALRLVERRSRVQLRKRIPPGAGLGGGSSDAAAVLRFAEVLDAETAARLGADVPFCVRGGRAMVRGIGEVIEPLPHEELHFVLLTPPFSVSTPAVYRRFDELGASTPQDGANDLEAAALSVEPQLETYRALLESATERTPTLAGSGSTFFVECQADEATSLARAVEEQLARAHLTAMVIDASSTSGFA